MILFQKTYKQCNSLYLFSIILAFFQVVFAELPFPLPEFGNGYAIPSVDTIKPQSIFHEYLDIIVFAILLLLGAWAVLKVRSRKLVFLIMVFSLIYFGFIREGCVCAVGSVQNVTLSFINSSYVLPVSVAIIFLLPLLTALFFGRIFCACVCPLGAIQDIVIFKPLKLPQSLNAVLKTIPELYLLLTILFLINGTGFIICQLDPFVPIFRIGGSTAMLYTGGIFLLIGIFIARPYCRFVCPYGVLLKWFSKLSIYHCSITPKECTQCKLCEHSCPVSAITKPASAITPEPQKKGIRRVGILVLLLPFWIIVFGWLGSRIAIPSHMKSYINQVEEKIATFAEEKKTETEDIKTEAIKKEYVDQLSHLKKEKNKLTIYGWIFGCLFGILFAVATVRKTVIKQKTDYQPDKGDCISCARCFEYCPVEEERIKINPNRILN